MRYFANNLSKLTTHRKWIPIASMLLAALLTLNTQPVEAKLRVSVKWVCCPGRLIIVISGGANARQFPPNAEATITTNKVTLTVDNPDKQKEYAIDQESPLDANTAKALGYSEVVILPGKYPLTPVKGGKFSVTLNARTKPLNK